MIQRGKGIHFLLWFLSTSMANGIYKQGLFSFFGLVVLCGLLKFVVKIDVKPWNNCFPYLPRYPYQRSQSTSVFFLLFNYKLSRHSMSKVQAPVPSSASKNTWKLLVVLYSRQSRSSRYKIRCFFLRFLLLVASSMEHFGSLVIINLCHLLFRHIPPRAWQVQKRLPYKKLGAWFVMNCDFGGWALLIFSLTAGNNWCERYLLSIIWLFAIGF